MNRTSRSFRPHLRIVRAAALAAGLCAASAHAAEHASEYSEQALLAQCAARDLQIVILLEEASVTNPRHPALASAGLDLMAARRVCFDDRKPGALARYDALIGTLTSIAARVQR